MRFFPSIRNTNWTAVIHVNLQQYVFFCLGLGSVEGGSCSVFKRMFTKSPEFGNVIFEQTRYCHDNVRGKFEMKIINC